MLAIQLDHDHSFRMKTSFGEVKAAWDKFHDLGPCSLGDHAKAYMARENAWREYVQVRDRFLSERKMITLPPHIMAGIPFQSVQ